MPGEEHRLLDIEGDRSVAMLHRAAEPARCGVVIVVGGPQYRVGSHRQFVRLAREIASAGFDVLRFDARGMGDSEGSPRPFDALEIDIRHAIDELCRNSPSIGRVVLLGLCDGATASLLYAPGDARIAGLILMNPWAHSESGSAKVRLRSYYLMRLFSRGFWRKLLAGDVALDRSVADLSNTTRSAVSGSSDSKFLVRMERAGLTYTGNVLVILSGQDYTADEFVQWISAAPTRLRLLQRPGVTVSTIKNANHTFSANDWHSSVSRSVVHFLEALA